MCVLHPAVVNGRCLGRCVRTMGACGNAAPEILSALAVLDSYFLSQRRQPYKQHVNFFATVKSLVQHNDMSLQSGSCNHIIPQRTQGQFDRL